MGIYCCALNDVAAASALQQNEWEVLGRLCGELESWEQLSHWLRDQEEVEAIVCQCMKLCGVNPSSLFFFVAPRLQKQERLVGHVHPVYFADWDVTFRLRDGAKFLLE